MKNSALENAWRRQHHCHRRRDFEYAKTLMKPIAIQLLHIKICRLTGHKEQKPRIAHLTITKG